MNRCPGTAAGLAAALALGGLSVAGAADADTGNLSYRCSLPVLGRTSFAIAAGTNAPATLRVGRSVTPTLTTRAQMPASLAGLAASGLKAVTVEGTITSYLTTNGTVTPVVQKIAKKSLPGKPSSAITLVATGKLAKVAAKAPGTRTYRPGTLKITLTFRTAAGKPAQFKNIPCTPPKTTKTIDTIKVLR